MKMELDRCPFCDGSYSLVAVVESERGFVAYVACCSPDCQATGPRRDAGSPEDAKAKAEFAWNVAPRSKR